MFKKVVAGTALAVALVWILTAQPGGELKTAVDSSLKAMGAESVRTLVFSGEGWDGCVGQGFSPASGWRKFANKNYVRSVDFEAKGWRMQRLRTDYPPFPKGGCSAGPYPDTPQNQVISVAAPNATFNNKVEYEFLPLGFLKTALEKNASVKQEMIKGKKYTVLSFMEGNAPMTGYINDKGYVERIETKIDNNVFGDMVWDVVHTDWKDFGGVQFPTKITQHQGGSEFFYLAVNDVKINIPVDLTQQAKGGPGGAKGKGDAKGKGGPAAPASISEDLGGGFWLITGGYASIVADFKDGIIVVEGGQNEARSQAVMAEAKKLIPNKPIKYVLNTHGHYDHTGGLRAYAAEGVTIVTHQANKGYYEKLFKNPHTIVPDKLSQMNPPPKVKVEYVKDKHVFTDGTHTIELYRVQGSTHYDGMLIAYLPQQKVLLEGDEFNVGPANAPAPAKPNPYHVNLLANIERLGLQVDRIIPVHLPNDGRKVALAELKTAAGKQ